MLRHEFTGHNRRFCAAHVGRVFEVLLLHSECNLERFRSLRVQRIVSLAKIQRFEKCIEQALEFLQVRSEVQFMCPSRRVLRVKEPVIVGNCIRIEELLRRLLRKSRSSSLEVNTPLDDHMCHMNALGLVLPCKALQQFESHFKYLPETVPSNRTFQWPR